LKKEGDDWKEKTEKEKVQICRNNILGVGDRLGQKKGGRGKRKKDKYVKD